MSHSYAGWLDGGMPTYNAGALTMLDWGWDAASAAVVKRGTFSKTEICVAPDGEKFSESVELSITSSVLTLLPATLSANLGDEEACGMLGASVTS